MIGDLKVDTSDYRETVLLGLKQESEASWYAFQKRPLWSLERRPQFMQGDIFHEHFGALTHHFFVLFSIPTYCFVKDIEMDEISYTYV